MSVSFTATADLVAVWKTTKGQRFQNYRAVFTVLDAPDDLMESPSATVIEKVVGDLRLHNVSFRYPNTNAEVLTGINITITPG